MLKPLFPILKKQGSEKMEIAARTEGRKRKGY
jgi:hypothetical protein